MNKNKLQKNTLNVLIGATVSVAGIALVNKLIFNNACKKNLLYSEQKDYYPWRYGDVFYTVKGQGSPVLLLHGIGCGSSSYEFKDISDELAKTHTVYEIDLLGFGRSDKPKLTYTAYLYVQLLSDFVQQVIKEPTDIIASSLSCGFAVMCCHHNDKLFKRIMLVNPLSPTRLMKSPNRFSNLSRKFLETPIVGTTIYNYISSKMSIKGFLKDKAFYNKSKVSRKMINTFYEAAHLSGSSAKYSLASFMTRYMNTDIRKALASIDNSIYILWSKDEPFSNSSIIEEYQDLNPSIEYSIVEDSVLLPHIEKPQAFLDICEFYLG